MATKTKSRVAKVKNKQGFKFRWWMVVVLIAVVAIVGAIVVRFSQAASVFTLNCQTQPCSNAQPPPAGYVSLPAILYPEPGKPAWFSLQANRIFGPNDGRASSSIVRACYTIISATSSPNGKRFRLDIQSDNGSAGPQEGVIYAAGTYVQCITRNVAEPSDNNRYLTFNLFAENEQLGLAQVVVEASSVGGGSPQPGPTTPPPVQNPNRQSLNFPAGTIITTCGYRNVSGYALVCPEGNWEYLGLSDAWVGTWEQNRVHGATHEHDVGYWKYGNFCGVKSHIISDPKLDFQSGSHMYLVNCPTANTILNFKRQNYVPPVSKGAIYITKYGPNGPIPANGALKSNPSTVPGNTGVCVKNRAGETFACNGENPIVLNGILVSGNTYQVFTTAQAGWKITKTFVNGETKFSGGQNFVNTNVNVVSGQTSFVDIYFDRL